MSKCKNISQNTRNCHLFHTFLETFIYCKKTVIDIQDIIFVHHICTLFATFCHHSFHHHTNHIFQINCYLYLLFAIWGHFQQSERYHLTLNCSFKIKGCQPLLIGSIIVPCAIGHFVHLLFSVCNLYIVLSILLQNAPVHGYLICPCVLCLEHCMYDVVRHTITL